MSTAGLLSNYAGNRALSYLLVQRGLYLACHTSAPDGTTAGDASSELGGGGYQRQPISFNSPSGKACVASNRQRFPGMPSCVLTHLAVWDAFTMGNMIVAVALLPHVSVPDSGLFVVSRGDLSVQL
jgi:hypothetical protein